MVDYNYNRICEYIDNYIDRYPSECKGIWRDRELYWVVTAQVRALYGDRDVDAEQESQSCTDTRKLLVGWSIADKMYRDHYLEHTDNSYYPVSHHKCHKESVIGALVDYFINPNSHYRGGM